MNAMHGDMWSVYPTADKFIITTNSWLKANGAVVMGRGIAKVARDRFPGIDIAMGNAIASNCGHMGVYGFLEGSKICAFQVKRHFKEKAELDLIIRSCNALTMFAIENRDLSIHLNFPGIGYGGLDIQNVLPIVSKLPDNVNVWTYKPLDA